MNASQIRACARDSLRYALGVAGWSLFWVAVVLGLVALVVCWHLFSNVTGV